MIADNAVIMLHGRRRELSLALEFAESMPVRDARTYIRLLSACAKVRCCLHHLRKMSYMLNEICRLRAIWPYRAGQHEQIEPCLYIVRSMRMRVRDPYS